MTARARKLGWAPKFGAPAQQLKFLSVAIKPFDACVERAATQLREAGQGGGVVSCQTSADQGEMRRGTRLMLQRTASNPSAEVV